MPVGENMDIELKYDPYARKVHAKYDGNEISSYSSIYNFENGRFIEWACQLTESLYSEVNCDYHLKMICSDAQAEIVRVLAENDTHCTGFEKQGYEINTGVSERLEMLELLYPADKELRLSFTAGDFELLRGICEILTEHGLFEEDGILYRMSGCPHVNVCLSPEQLLGDMSGTVLFFTDRMPDERMISELAACDAFFIVCVIGDRDGFVRYQQGFPVFTVDAYNMDYSVFEMISELILPDVFFDSYSEILRLISQGELLLTESETVSLRQAALTDISYTFEYSRSLYAGRSCDIAASVLPLKEISVEYRSQDESIAAVKGCRIMAVAPGETNILAIDTQGVNVIKRLPVCVRDEAIISRIEVFPRSVFAAVGDICIPEYKYYPEDAVNAAEIDMISSDPSVAAAVDGIISAVGCGVCEVYLGTPEASAVVTVTVQEGMTDIRIPSASLEIKAGCNVRWKPLPVPEDAFGGSRIKVVSSDESIALYSGGYIVGIKPGSVSVTVSSHDGKIKKVCRVTCKK